MESPDKLHPHDEEQRTYILITGANSGLGFGICQRLIDDFIATRPSFQSLSLIITTRNKRKSDDTVSRLQRHIGRKSAQLESPLATRITLQPETLDLTSLSSVLNLAQKLLKQTRHIDSIILNAGYGGIIGINWLSATWSMLTDFVDANTYPTFKLSDSGQVTAPQRQINSSPIKGEGEVPKQPPLGLVFTSNIFGHYILSHLLIPLLSASPDNGRIICISSLEAYSHTFSSSDIQGLHTEKAYESSKRLTDLLVLTSNLPSTTPFTKRFFSSPPSTPHHRISLHDNEPSQTSLPECTAISLMDNTLPTANRGKPSLYLSHPGICGTSFVPLPYILFYLMTLSFYVARLLGSPWHTGAAYKGACAPVWLALNHKEEIDDLEIEEGKAKWGSGCNWLGREKVTRTGVSGWGVGGRAGEGNVRPTKGRGAIEVLTKEGREEFEQVGRECWKQMEELRVFWERWMVGEEE